MKKLIVLCLFSVLIVSCKKKEGDPDPTPTPSTTTGSTPTCPTCNFPDTSWTATGTGPKLIFKFVLDSTQARLDNTGAVSTIAAGNAGQSPKFNFISAHYIELAQGDMTAIGSGIKLYHAPETTCGGSVAIVHCQSVLVKNNEVFFSVPISSVTAGTYKWLRVSLSYQNYDIKIKTTSAGIIDGTIASFVGYRTYVSKYKMHGAVMTPTAGGGVGNKSQGYWGFYAKVFGVDVWKDGQAAGTTVVNPNFANTPTPNGSCLVQGLFVTSAAPTVGAPLVITGSETSDIIITVSLSTNKSFEWTEITQDGYFQPEIGETPVDMGLRGMVPKY